MTRRERRLVQVLVGVRTVWVDGVAMGVVGGRGKRPGGTVVVKSGGRMREGEKGGRTVGVGR